MQRRFTDIGLDVADGVATIMLDRPPLNILTVAMVDELDAALDLVAPDSRVKALVLRASGKAFCAGVDVAEHVPGRVDVMIRNFGRLFARLRAFPAATVAVVQGAALGGGAELAVACDMVLAARSARLGQPEISLGVFPPIAAALFPGLIGYQQAARLVLTGELIAAEEAARIGLVTFAIADDEVPARLDALLERLRGASAPVLRLAKRALLAGADHGIAEALTAVEDLYLADLMATDDAVEGVQSFLEKRSPIWRDK